MMLFRDKFPEFEANKDRLRHAIKTRVGLIKTKEDFNEMVDVMTDMIHATLNDDRPEVEAALVEAFRWSRDLK